MARIVRQFEAPHELVTLEKVIELPALPTMGTRLDLRSEGAEAPLEVVSVTLRPESDGPPEADLFLAYEPLAAAQLARFSGWRTPESRQSRPCQSPLKRRRAAQRAYVPLGRALCPVCRKAPLKGQQTVCSGRCRAQRHRRARADRDREVRGCSWRRWRSWSGDRSPEKVREERPRWNAREAPRAPAVIATPAACSVAQQDPCTYLQVMLP